MRTTPRQTKAAAAYLFGDAASRRRPTQAEVAKRFGVSRQAIAGRLKRFVESLEGEQRRRYLQCVSNRRRGTRTVLLQLNFADQV